MGRARDEADAIARIAYEEDYPGHRYDEAPPRTRAFYFEHGLRVLESRDERHVLVDLDPDQTDAEILEHGATRRLAVLRGGKIVEITGAPDRETR